MKNITLGLLILSSLPAFAGDYFCFPTSKDGDQSIYILKTSGQSIELGFGPTSMKKGILEINKEHHFLNKYLQFGLDDFTHAFFSPSMNNNGKKIKMYIDKNNIGSTTYTKYTCNLWIN